MSNVLSWIGANIIMILVALCCLALVIVCIVIAVKRSKAAKTHVNPETQEAHEFVAVPVESDETIKGMKDVKKAINMDDINDTLSRL